MKLLLATKRIVFSLCRLLQGKDTYTANAQHDHLAAQSEWPIGEGIGLPAAGAAYLRTID